MWGLGVLYLLVALFFGLQIINYTFPDPYRLFLGVAFHKKSLTLVPPILFYFPAGFLLGILLLTFMSFLFSLFMAPLIPENVSVLYPANLASGCLVVYLSCILGQQNLLQKNPDFIPESQLDQKSPPVTASTPSKLAKIIPFKNTTSAKTALSSSSTPTELKSDFRSSSSRFLKFWLFPSAKDKLNIDTYSSSKKSLSFFGITLFVLFLCISFLFSSSLFLEGRTLYVGSAISQAMAPQIALSSSFAKGVNFPPQFPYFAGDGMQTNFLLDFLAGNLQVLGFAPHQALSIPSIFIFLSALTLLGVLSVLLSGHQIAFLFAPVLVLWRSSGFMKDYWSFLQVKAKSENIFTLQAWFKNENWFGKNPYDDTGIWSISALIQKRSFLLGFGLTLVVLFLLLPFVRRFFIHLKRQKDWNAKIKYAFKSRTGYLPRPKDPLRPYSIIMITCLIALAWPFFDRESFFAMLLIVGFLAIFAENRLGFFLFISVGSISYQLQHVLWGSNVSQNKIIPHWGFVLQQPNLLEIIGFLINLLGLSFFLLLFHLLSNQGFYRGIVFIACSIPLTFLFFFQTSPYPLISTYWGLLSVLLFPIFVASVLGGIWNFPFQKFLPFISRFPSYIPTKKNPTLFSRTNLGKFISIVFLLYLASTGFSEWVIFNNQNSQTQKLSLNSPLERWITEKTAGQTIFLTAPYEVNSFFLSGRLIYWGSPFYAWSVGHSVNQRQPIYQLLTAGLTTSSEHFVQLCEEENIKYILVDDIWRNHPEFPVNEGFLQQHSTPVASFPSQNNTMIYSVNSFKRPPAQLS